MASAAASSFESLCLGMLDAIAALARGALRTLLGVSTVYANARGMQRPQTKSCSQKWALPSVLQAASVYRAEANDLEALSTLSTRALRGQPRNKLVDTR